MKTALKTIFLRGRFTISVFVACLERAILPAILNSLKTKRLGQTHTQPEIAALIEALMAGTMADYQASAWLMAVCINGLTLDEVTWLTQAYVESGQTLDWSDLDGVVVDKHSTGGVGDKTTLVVVPLLAAAGVKVAKLSGRGLGFTGGTIDKLEAIPGFRADLSNEQIRAQLKTVGAVIGSQTQSLAPADGLLYALRDVTATVDCPTLIAASVVSKKIAAGAQTIVLDIKVGQGAFMKTLEEARHLAWLCQQIAGRLGRQLVTVLSSMEQPLGLAVGNALEVQEAVAVLKNEGPADVRQLAVRLAAHALVGAAVAPDLTEAEAILVPLLENGQAYQKFLALVAAQGGDVEALEDFNHLPQPDRISVLPASQTGYVSGIDSLKVAEAVQLMGGGRVTKNSPLNLGVGVLLHAKVGQRVKQGDVLAELYADNKHHLEALELLKQAFTFSNEPLEWLPPLILEE